MSQIINTLKRKTNLILRSRLLGEISQRISYVSVLFCTRTDSFVPDYLIKDISSKQLWKIEVVFSTKFEGKLFPDSKIKTYPSEAKFRKVG